MKKIVLTITMIVTFLGLVGVKAQAEEVININNYSNVKINDENTNMLLIGGNKEFKLSNNNIIEKALEDKNLIISVDKKSPQVVQTPIEVLVDNFKEECVYSYYIENENLEWERINSQNNKIIFSSDTAGIKRIKVVETSIYNVNKNKIAIFEFEFKDKPLIINELEYNFSKNLIYNNKPDSIVYHHAAASSFSPLQVNSTHKGNGWSGIGYHYYILKDGTIYRGRPENAVGSHSPSKNTDSIGICVEGDYTKELMPEAQKKAIVNLSKDIVNRYSIKEVGGHKDYYSTACPGVNFPLQEIKVQLGL